VYLFANKSTGEGKKRVNKTSLLTAIKVRAPGAAEKFAHARAHLDARRRESYLCAIKAGLLFEIRR
jgi:hypothetical protein